MPDDHIALRAATVADIPMLRRWEQQPHVREAGVEEWDWEDDLARVSPFVANLVADLNGRPIGFVQIIDPANEPEHYWGDMAQGLRAVDIWIGEAAYLGHGYGTAMMRAAIERCFASPDVTAIVIDPLATNVRAQRFYERLGFRPVERRRFGEDDCLVMRLERASWEHREGA